MKKIFTLVAAAMMAVGVNAQKVLVNFNGGGEYKVGTFTYSGSTAESTVKINTNTTSVPCIKLANSYTTENALNENYFTIETEGGFKAGDVITIAGAFNNADNTKLAKVDIFTTVDNVLFTTQQFINGRLVNDAPVEETYTLTADAEKLYFGRNGNTGANVTALKVVRPSEAPDEPVNADKIDFRNGGETKVGTFTYSGSTAESTVKLNTNITSVPCIKLANSYTTENALNENYFTIETEGGFKAGDVITIAGAFNNADNTKLAKVDIFTTVDNVLFTTQQFINGRLVNDAPVEETYTLTADAEKLYFGRNGNTAANVTTLKVTRDTKDGIKNLPISVSNANAPIYNLAGQQVSKDFKGVCIQNGKKFINK